MERFKFIKILFGLVLFLAFVFLATIFFDAEKVSAADCDINKIDLISVTAPRSVGGKPKVMPGENIQVTILNNCDTNKVSVNIYVHPKSINPGTDFQAIEPYKKVSGTLIDPSQMQPIDIFIQGNQSGDFTVRVIAYKADNSGNLISGPTTKTSDIIIATEGIVFSNDSSSTVKKGEIGQYKIKIYAHAGEKFSIYIDNPDDSTKLKKQDVPITSNIFDYTYSWDTAGTDIGSHKVIAFIDEINQDGFPVNVTDPNSGGSTGGGVSTFSITRLNTFNIKNLLENNPACAGKKDLSQVLCIVETVIDWLLDIAAVIAVIMILYASIVYLTSYGEESKAELAKKTLMWSVIGVIVIGVAKGIMLIVENIFKQP